MVHRILSMERLQCQRLAIEGYIQLLARPGHCPIGVVQAQVGRTGDGLVAHPLFTRTVRAGDEQTVRVTHKNRPLEGQLEAAAIM